MNEIKQIETKVAEEKMEELVEKTDELIEVINKSAKNTKITIAEIDIPAWDLICFMVKASFCSIPATIIIFLIWCLIVIVFGGMFLGFIL